MNEQPQHRSAQEPAPTRAYDPQQWGESASWQPAQPGTDEATQRYNWQEDEVTRATASHTDTAAFDSYSSGSDRGSNEYRTQSTDELDEVRQVRSTYQQGQDEPTMVMPAQPAPPAAPAHPTPARPQQPTFESRPLSYETATTHPTTAEAAQRLRDELPGPGTGARIGSIVVAFLFAALVGFALWDLSRGPDSLVMGELVNNLITDVRYLPLLIGGIIGIAAAAVALSLMMSGLGAGLLGVVLVTGAAVLVISIDTAGPYVYLAPTLLTSGLFLIIAGIAAHVARVSGYRKARRIVEDM